MRPAIGYRDGMEMLLWLRDMQLMTTKQAARAAYEWGMAFAEPAEQPRNLLPGKKE